MQLTAHSVTQPESPIPHPPTLHPPAVGLQVRGTMPSFGKKGPHASGAITSAPEPCPPPHPAPVTVLYPILLSKVASSWDPEGALFCKMTQRACVWHLSSTDELKPHHSCSPLAGLPLPNLVRPSACWQSSYLCILSVLGELRQILRGLGTRDICLSLDLSLINSQVQLRMVN